MKVLIVDDRAENRHLLQEQLRSIEAVAVMAGSGALALREVRSQHFDLVITDLLMPEMDGFQLCYLLKTDPALKAVPVMIYTANYATKHDEDQARDLGADDFLTRPIDEEVLTGRIRQVMHRAEMGDVAEPRAKPHEGFFREYSSFLIEKLEDQLITAEENAQLQTANRQLQGELERRNEELTAANGELVRINGDLEAYCYSVSHDLRGPLRAIRGFTETLREEMDEALTPAARNFFTRIEANADRMNTLITGLLEHHRMRKAGAAMDRVELETTVDTAISNLEDVILAAQGTVKVTRPMPAVVAFGPALVQILINLIDNALKFVGPGIRPKVQISAVRAGENIRLTVQDNGIGIPVGSEQKLFEVFERLHPTQEYPGTGIGLAIVRRGVERMGGSAGIAPNSGSGCSFWIELKAARGLGA